MSLFDTQQPFILFNNEDNVACLDTAAGAGSEFGQADYSELNELHNNFPLGWNHVTPPVGAEYDDWAAGGGGQDYLHGEGGNDVLYGGHGFNLTNNPYAAPGQDYYDLGEITYPGTEIPVIHSISSYDFAADTLFGDQGNDALFGQAGYDYLDGGSGDDLLYGGTQGDTMYGGNTDGCEENIDVFNNSGEDTMYGERGHDLMYGGNEYYFPNWWSNRNHAGDYMDGGKGCDTMHGGRGSDTMYGMYGADVMFGEGDQDLMYGGNGHDFMDGGDEYAGYYYYYDEYYCAWDGFGDTMYGEAGRDTMYGGEADDYMDGGVGDDHMYGEQDDDRMYGQDGYDYMEGNDGCDTMYGGNQNDTMHGGSGHDYMEGDDGGDYMTGGYGNDTMLGENGHDTMHGNEGDDDMSGGYGHDYMTGGDGEDLMCGNQGNDTMYGNGDSDRMGGGDGDDVMYGGDEGWGYYAWRGGYVGWHELGDTMNGGSGRDYIDGQGGADMLFGGTGVDTLIGGDGADTINSGEGGTPFDWEQVDLGDDDASDTFVYEFAFTSAVEDEGNTAEGTDGYVYLQNFKVGDTLLLCNTGDEISELGCDDCNDPNTNKIFNLIEPNDEGQHAVVVKDNGQDTLIFFDDTTTPEDPSDPQILKNEAIWLEGVTGVGTEFGQFQDLLSLEAAGYNIVVHNGACDDFIVCPEDDVQPDSIV